MTEYAAAIVIFRVVPVGIAIGTVPLCFATRKFSFPRTVPAGRTNGQFSDNTTETNYKFDHLGMN